MPRHRSGSPPEVPRHRSVSPPEVPRHRSVSPPEVPRHQSISPPEEPWPQLDSGPHVQFVDAEGDGESPPPYHMVEDEDARTNTLGMTLAVSNHQIDI